MIKPAHFTWKFVDTADRFEVTVKQGGEQKSGASIGVGDPSLVQDGINYTLDASVNALTPPTEGIELNVDTVFTVKAFLGEVSSNKIESAIFQFTETLADPFDLGTAD